ncbi:MAG: BlaI/MecI/CopY family transcriptional regulator [Acidimicrobiales bacterium]
MASERTGRRGDGELEADVLGVLWGSDQLLTPAEVSDALDADLAYTTVMTVLTRLWKKGLATREPAGRGFAYRATLTETELATQRLHETIDSVADRHSLLAGFVGSLSKTDQRRLRSLLDGPNPSS